MQFFFLFIFLFLIFTGSGITKENQQITENEQKVPEFMESFVIDPQKPTPKKTIAFNSVYALNENMFTIYNRSLEIYKKNFLSHHNLIMGLFSGKGGRFILYRPGQPPLEAESVAPIYQIVKSVGHCAMATFVLVAPYTPDPSSDLSWLPIMKSYRVNVQSAIDSLDALDLEPSSLELLQKTLKQIAAFMDACIENQTYTFDEIQTWASNIKPDLAKLIDVATNAQVKHWWKVLEEWKKMIGKDWDTTYALSNSIYVARQNNILFSVLAQFFGEEAINDRLILLETTDFTTTPELMMDAFIRIVSDRLIGKVFFGYGRLMDFELLGGSGRKVIEAEAKRLGIKPILPPLVPYNSHEWPMKTNPKSGSGPSLMEEVH